MSQFWAEFLALPEVQFHLRWWPATVGGPVVFAGLMIVLSQRWRR